MNAPTPTPALGAVTPQLWLDDATHRLYDLEVGSCDLIYFDPPFGQTKAGWDVPLDLDQLLPAMRHASHDHTAWVVHSQGMFKAELMTAWRKHWKYDLVWHKKGSPRGFLNAKRRPLRYHEYLEVFYAKRQPTYNPQFTFGHRPLNKRGARKRTLRTGQVYGQFGNTEVPEGTETRRYPGSVIDIPPVKFPIFAVQKPLALAEWVLRTFTDAGDVVCDPTMGSGTAVVAGARLGRFVVGGDSEYEQVCLAHLRLAVEAGLRPELPQGLVVNDERTLAGLPNVRSYLAAIRAGRAA